MPTRVSASNSSISRFASAPVEPSRAFGLKPDHPAVVQGRTLFPKSVVNASDSPRLLVSGHNNPKLGKKVIGGWQDGWPIFHLTLEERATCPGTCVQWETCYGNAMPFALRHRASMALEARLDDEIEALAALWPRGFLVRLHTLGDFYSVAYVELWRALLTRHPSLHVFGYTARGEWDPIHRALRRVIMDLGWDRFAIRASGVWGVEGSVVVDEASPDPSLVMCPAQVEKTTACATCKLCWAPAVRGKTIGFLKHGMKRREAG